MKYPQVRISLRVAILVVVGLALGLFTLRVLNSSERVLGWIITAATLAALLYPIVQFLHRWMPRVIAAILVLLAIVAPIGVLTYGIVHDVAHQTNKLEKRAPGIAHNLDKRGWFKDAGDEIDFEKRVKSFVNAVPHKFAGGQGAQAVRTNTTRGVATLATGVLTIFLILNGHRLFDGAMRLIRDDKERERISKLTLRAYQRGVGYAYGAILFAVVAGCYAYFVARWRHVIAPTALAAWVGITDFVPIFGSIAGWLPIFAISVTRSANDFYVVFAAFIIYQLFESLVIRRFLAKRTMSIGVFVPAVSFLGGLELYGLGGALIAMFLSALFVAGAHELTDPNEGEPSGSVEQNPVPGFEAL